MYHILRCSISYLIADTGLEILRYGGLPYLVQMLDSNIEQIQLYSCKVLGTILPSKSNLRCKVNLISINRHYSR